MLMPHDYPAAGKLQIFSGGNPAADPSRLWNNLRPSCVSAKPRSAQNMMSHLNPSLTIYAFRACRALVAFVRSFYTVVVLTCDPGKAPYQLIYIRTFRTFRTVRFMASCFNDFIGEKAL
jgi:hypothetical protein